MANDASNRSGTTTDRSTGPDKIGVYDRNDTRTSGTTTGTTTTATTGARSPNTRWIILAIIAVLVILALVYIL
jgi:cobalamin biosynthesis Mg chelatase CobN